MVLIMGLDISSSRLVVDIPPVMLFRIIPMEPMVKFVRTDRELFLNYKTEFGPNDWVWNEIEKEGSVVISSVFYFDRTDLMNPPADAEATSDDYTYSFALGVFEGDYVRILGRFLGIDNDVIMPKDTKFRRTLFAYLLISPA